MSAQRSTLLALFAIVAVFQKGHSSQLTTFTSFPKSPAVEHGGNATTIVYVHDWNTLNIHESIKGTETLLNLRDDVENVVVADWSTISQSPDFYNLAERLTPRIATDVLAEIQNLVEVQGVDPSRLECIGHGIGAHVCGQVGKRWNENLASAGGKLGKIIGLNPTGPYFKEHFSESLGKSDASTVEAWHTDQRLGIYTEIGLTDNFITSGPEIEACQVRKLLKKNQCLHNAAVSIFLRSLQENVTAIQLNATAVEKIPMSILALDVSPSMQSYGRIQNLVVASKRLIQSLPLGYFIGIVVFGGEAFTTLSPTNITDDPTRLRIISNLPTVESQISNTSIGAGVLKSYEVIQPFLASESFCPDIILLTDGEENQAPFLRDLYPHFRNPCTKIHSIALGDEADPGLEALSEVTGGQTYFASDVDSRDKLTQSLVASSTSQFAIRKGMPVQLPPKKVTVDVPVSFEFDEGIGNDTTFLISTHHPEEVEAELIGPNGVTYGVGNYTVDTDLHQLLFKLLEVQAGNWTIKLNPGARTIRRKRQAPGENEKREATVFVTSYPSDANVEPVRLEASLSARLLDYSAPKSIAIEAYLYRGDDAILEAIVEAQIFSSDGSRVTVDLLDNGAGADEFKDDGIYTRFITTPLLPGKRYQVDVRAISAKNGTTKVRSGDGDPYKVNYDELTPLKYRFERQANAGSFRVSPTSPSLPNLPPNPVRDLRVVHVDEETRQCTLTWTAAGKVLDNNGTVDSIRIQAFTGHSNKNGSDQSGFTFTEEHFVGGSLNPGFSGTTQNVTVEVPQELWEGGKKSPNSKPNLYFTVQSLNAEGGWSGHSNVAPMEFGFKHNPGWTLFQIVLIVIMSLVLLIILVSLLIFLTRKRKFFKVQNSFK